MLKLIINNADHLSRGALSKQSNNIDKRFEASHIGTILFDCMKIASNLYTFRTRDLEHDLNCEMTLELTEGFALINDDIREENCLMPIMKCNFPTIDTARFNEKVCWDECLQGNILVQFQLRILEELLLLCEEKDASHLVLIINNIDDDNLEVYRHFAASEKQVITAREDQTEIVISTDLKVYDEVVELMDKVDEDFRQTLWRNQKTNPAFRNYLKSHSLLMH